MFFPFIDYSLIGNFEREAKAGGLQKAALDFLGKLLVSSIEVQGEFPVKGPLLIISNHPTAFDTVTLCAVVPRSDFHFIAQEGYHIYGPTLESHLLPIYRPMTPNHYFFEYPLHFSLKKRRKRFPLAESQAKNRETIWRAAELVSEGHAVSIFPMGDVGKAQTKRKWKAGIGYLVKQITAKSTQVIFVNIQGGQKRDYWKFVVPPLRHLFFKKTSRTLKLSKPLPLQQFISTEMTEKEVVRVLEQKYEQYFHE